MQKVLQAFHDVHPDAAQPSQAVSFGTSGHRGRALEGSFNLDHILAITQAVVDYRRETGIAGPLFLGRDSNALSAPAWECALQLLVANGVAVHIERDGELTATPLISRAILHHNAAGGSDPADGLIVTPSHNPPEDGDIKYYSPHGGPAEGEITGEIEWRANRYLGEGVMGLHQGWLAFGGEESAGASFLTRAPAPGPPTKDGILLCLLAAEDHGGDPQAPQRLLPRADRAPRRAPLSAGGYPLQPRAATGLQGADPGASDRRDIGGRSGETGDCHGVRQSGAHQRRESGNRQRLGGTD